MTAWPLWERENQGQHQTHAQRFHVATPCVFESGDFFHPESTLEPMPCRTGLPVAVRVRS
jgi:hypothetical protein